ncbi:glycerophosphodiester phosphodiesterase family protein [Veronia pacifica]|uniref:Glycerophosphoryl diester phosphodiesterase n=1 Tax=Veronia pacifica TaxID=1080227 RepID=A0A1C3EPQ7_9GAMM|nr:glycerophosphodiester phosphodiesterase family protein [Veronia pacifica]ODA35206.1 glycerophosphoryl diester phosphodiesterase [Veronia pacifica]
MKTLFAHRGMSSLAPENTLSAFSIVKSHGIGWIECDVDVLADGTVVVSHDDTLDRCTDKTGSLYALNQSDLTTIDAGSWFGDEFSGEPLPTFEQLIELVNEHQLNINVEIKSCAAGWPMTLKLIDGVIKGLEQLSPTSELLVSCFNHLALAEFKRKQPHVDVACLFEAEDFGHDWLSSAQSCSASAIHLNDLSVDKETVARIKAAGYRVNVYTVNDFARANQLFNWGVDGIFTDIGHEFPSRYRQY